MPINRQIIQKAPLWGFLPSKGTKMGILTHFRFIGVENTEQLRSSGDLEKIWGRKFF